MDDQSNMRHAHSAAARWKTEYLRKLPATRPAEFSRFKWSDQREEVKYLSGTLAR